ncbi:MAG: gamma-glutamyltransferase family protein [Paracoccus sp. (in: a-proteobacteria)]|uniref:gamma-glutamyltransferase family protein n=1 Tax=Paracoccus sp. TaxID=267 RepID=UPI0026DFE2F6|nr:gamma-glutamyltransferase family protein [Paracoccus sp. (in: a-proteobacteria)]MDO5620344.1 gamma-glutamyltransferase family protein [Paracoccus sp. (in: a-proteobacteria)]
MRPIVQGYFGAVTSTHWLGTAVGMAVLERGGNAFDAAVATGLVLQVVEPHLNGPGGDLPAIIHAGGETRVLCAQGPAPAGATIAHYRGQGLKLIPGNGLLATVIPGAFDGWLTLLRDYGTMELAEVLEPAIFYAERGHPILPRAAAAIAGLAEFFRAHWPGSAALWLPDGQPPQGGGNFRNPALAATWRRVLAESSGAATREARIDAARDCFYRGFIAEQIDAFCRQPFMDESGAAHAGVLTGDDLAGYAATWEAPVTLDFHGWRITKAGPWTQGPAFLQTLALMAGENLAALDPLGSEYLHLLTEAMKLAFADREAYYGDPDFSDIPVQALLSPEYNAARCALIGDRASYDLRPGVVPGFDAQVAHMRGLLDRLSLPEGAVYEPTMAHLGDAPRGDTVHLDVIDRWGNVVSATPSGGWLQSSPVIPGLGFCLNSRAQMFWLEEGAPTSLAPGRRPRTTLTPGFATTPDGAHLAFGTPGGDQQDQWQLQFFLRHAVFGMDLQRAIDAPVLHTLHIPSSFYPRSRQPGQIAVESDMPAASIEGLRQRGHDVTLIPAQSAARLTAARRDPDGLVSAAATSRMGQAYAMGR